MCLSASQEWKTWTWSEGMRVIYRACTHPYSLPNALRSKLVPRAESRTPAGLLVHSLENCAASNPATCSTIVGARIGKKDRDPQRWADGRINASPRLIVDISAIGCVWAIPSSLLPPSLCLPRAQASSVHVFLIDRFLFGHTALRTPPPSA